MDWTVYIRRTLSAHQLYLRSRSADGRVNKEDWTVDVLSAVLTFNGHERD